MIKRQAKNGEQIIFQGASEDNNISDFQSSLKVASMRTYFLSLYWSCNFQQINSQIFTGIG